MTSSNTTEICIQLFIKWNHMDENFVTLLQMWMPWILFCVIVNICYCCTDSVWAVQFVVKLFKCMVSVCPAFKPPSLLCIFSFNFACDFEIHDLMASILLNACLLFGNPLFFTFFVLLHRYNLAQYPDDVEHFWALFNERSTYLSYHSWGISLAEDLFSNYSRLYADIKMDCSYCSEYFPCVTCGSESQKMLNESLIIANHK